MSTLVRADHRPLFREPELVLGSRPDPRKQVAKGAFIANLFVVFAVFVIQGGFEHVSGPGGALTTASRLAGIFAVNLCLVQLLLMGRNPWLDRWFGMDQLARWHRVVGHACFDLIVAHIALVVVGYARMTSTNIFSEVRTMVFEIRDILMAVASFVCFCLVVLSSIRIARRKLRYETWFHVHLYAYLAIALAVPHQIYAGTTFVSTSFGRLYWSGLYAFAVGSLLLFRVIMPLWNMAVYNLRVAEVVYENHNVVSVYISGRNLENLKARAGQFFIWRFLCRGQWWQAHPYSLSAAPPGERHVSIDTNWLRITVKDLGDGSSSIASLPVGTRVIAEGPFGTFVPRNGHRPVLLIAGGVGITPLRAMLESIPMSVDVTLLYRARYDEDLVLYEEIDHIARRRGANVHIITGERNDFYVDPLSAKHLHYLVPTVSRHEVYVCGPVALTETVISSLHRLGVPDDRIHYEAFQVQP